MCATTPSVTWWRASSGPRASTCCTPWAGTPSGYRPRTPPSSAAPIPASGRTRTSTPCATSSGPWACPLTGPASSRPATHRITSTNKRCSWISSRRAWPTARSPGSTGIRWTTRCWRTNRSSTARAGAPALPWNAACCRNGSSRSPTTPTTCWTPSRAWTAGRKRSAPCRPTGSAGPRVPESSGRWTGVTTRSKCSPPGPIPSMARRSSPCRRITR